MKFSKRLFLYLLSGVVGIALLLFASYQWHPKRRLPLPDPSHEQCMSPHM